MKLQQISTGAHDLKQFTMRLNIQELDALLVVIEMANTSIPRVPTTTPLKEVRRNINIAKLEMNRALKELSNN